MTQAHDRGFLGEQTIGFLLGECGYMLLAGPGGSAGHNITAPGFDGVAYPPEARHVVIYDNKSYRRAGNVASATAIDSARNLMQNLQGLIATVQAMSDVPYRILVLHLLRKAEAALMSGTPWPEEVSLAVFNAYGNSTGVTRTLEQRGVVFLGVEDFGKPTHRGRLPIRA